jgi:outer membrane protein W
MKNRGSMERIALLAGLLAFVFPLSTSAETTFDHSLGLSYISGFPEVKDFYVDNFNIEDTTMIPVGLFYTFTTNFDIGMRIDAGIGPFAYIGGDIEYYDVPLRLQGGYTFAPSASFRPYLKAGFSYHISDGDYVKEKAGVGFLGSAGFEWGKRGKISGFVEISHDTAEATFDSRLNGPIDFARKRNRTEDIKVHGTIISAGVTF